MDTSNIEIHNAFPTPFYVRILDEKDEIQKEISAVIDDVEYQTEENPVWGTYTADSARRSITKTYDVVNEFQLKTLDQCIHFNVNAFRQILKAPEYNYYLESWFTKTEIGQINYPHVHMDADISGLYYYRTTGTDGSIHFLSPVQSACASNIFQNAHKNLVFTPQEGMLILFPSWVWHFVNMNKEDTIRTSVAFNIYYDKRH